METEAGTGDALGLLERSKKELSRVLVTVLLHLGSAYTGMFTL